MTRSAEDRDGHGDPDADRARQVWGRAEDGAVVRLSGASQEAEGEWWWPPTGLSACARPEDRPSLTIEIDHAEPGLGVRVDGRSLPGGWLRVESDLSLFTAEHLQGRVAIHAAVVVWRGSVIVLPGRSHAGKSTLALALVDLGATLLSDEYALIEPGTALVSGWRRAARRRLLNGTVEQVPLTAPDPGPLPVSLIAALRYEPAAPSVIDPIGRAEGALVLLDNTVSAQRHPEAAFAAAVAVARSARSVRGTRGDAHAEAHTLLAALGLEGAPR